MGAGSYQTTKPNQTPNATKFNSGVRPREISSGVERETAQTAS